MIFYIYLVIIFIIKRDVCYVIKIKIMLLLYRKKEKKLKNCFLKIKLYKVKKVYIVIIL